MQIGLATLSLGFVLAIVVLLIAVLGVIGVVPLTATVVFGLVGALAVARLC